MRILAIRLKNLTSIEGAVEVDFTSEPLHSAGIFAISGPTGAEKGIAGNVSFTNSPICL